MKAVLVTSVACAAISLLGILAVLAMSVAPGVERDVLLVAVGVFLVGWSALAVWARRRLRFSQGAALSTDLKTAVIAAGIAYVLLVLLCCVG